MWALVLGILFSCDCILGLRCYTCSVGYSDEDMSCVTNPESVVQGSPITNCNMKYCTIERREYRDPAGKISSMVRGCMDTPRYINKDIQEDYFMTYYRACQQDLCNSGSGQESSGIGLMPDQGPPGILMVEGVGSGTSIAKIGRVLGLVVAVQVIAIF